MSLHGKKLALLLIGTDDDGEEEWAVFPGVLEQTGLKWPQED